MSLSERCLVELKLFSCWKRSSARVACVLIAAALLFAGEVRGDGASIALELAEWEEDARRTTELQQSLLADPEDEEGWIELLELLQGSGERNRSLALVARRRDWEPQPALHEDQEARERNDLLLWTSAAVAAHPENAEFRLRLLGLQANGDPSLKQVKELVEEIPNNVRLAFCYARGLAEEKDLQAGAESLARFVAAYPDDPDAYQAQIVFLRDVAAQPEAALAVQQERVRQFPDEPLFRSELMGHAASVFSEPASVRSLLVKLEREAASSAERADLCWGLLGIPSLEGMSFDCFQRLFAQVQEEGTDLEQSTGGVWLGDSLVVGATEFDREDWLLEILDRLSGRKAAEAWSWTFFGEQGGSAPCEWLLFAAASGKFGEPSLSPTRHELDGIGAWRSLADDLQTCGDSETARHLRRAALRKASIVELARLADPAGGDIAQEVLRRFREAPRSEEVLAAIASNPANFPEIPQGSVLQAWAEVSELPEPALKLATLLRKEGRHDEEGEALDLALSKSSENLDLRLLRAGAAFSAGDMELARNFSRKVLKDIQGTARQHATARYILGRVARRQGQMEEASDHLEHYFLRRLTYAGCCPGETDEGLLAHLWQTAAPERLEAYRKAKAQALLAFRAASGEGVFEVCGQLSCELAAGVAGQGQSLAESAVGEALAKRHPDPHDRQLQQLAAKNDRQERWKVEDPEDLFQDDQVLGFDPAGLGIPPLTEVVVVGCNLTGLSGYPFGSLLDPSTESCPWQ